MLRRRLPKPSDDDERQVVANIREHGWHAMHVRDEFHPEHAGLPQPDRSGSPAAPVCRRSGRTRRRGHGSRRMRELHPIRDDGAHFGAGTIRHGSSLRIVRDTC